MTSDGIGWSLPTSKGIKGLLAFKEINTIDRYRDNFVDSKHYVRIS